MQTRWRSSFLMLKSTWAILGGICIGILLGLYNKSMALQIAPFGDLYLSFLKMCVIPIMVTAVVSSMGRMLLNKDSSRYLKKMIIVFIVSLFAVSAIGLSAGLLGKPGAGLSDSDRLVLGQVLSDAESGMTSASASFETNSEGLPDFIFNIIPSNIFTALGNGDNLQILFFSIIFGIAVGLVPSNANAHLLTLAELVFNAFQQAISWTMYVLPFGLLCIMAGQIASTGIGLLLAMAKFIVLIYIVSVFFMLISAKVIAYKTEVSYLQSFRYLKKSLIIAFGTRNSIATMPSVLEALQTDFKMDTKTIHLVIPLGVILCRYSMVLIFSMAVMFMAQLYQVPLGWGGLFIALIGCILAAVAGAGSPGVVSLSMLSMVSIPLGLPYGATVILLLAIIPIIDPIVTTANIHLNCAAAVCIADRDDGIADIESQHVPSNTSVAVDR